MPELSTRDQIVILADNFERSYPHEIVSWAALAYGEALVMATGFGPEGIVILHILHQVAPRTTVFYLDTDLFFPETYQLKEDLEARFNMTFVRVATDLSVDEQTRQFGPDLWELAPNDCCRLRKVLPLREYLRGKKAWITAIRRDQTAHRASAKAIEWDATNNLVKVNPLINWTLEQVWTYIHLFELPVNPLHHQGYPSIGCAPCTRPVAEGADPRSGRWVGREKIECGIHMQLGDEQE